jgi:hypothetical protein
MAMCEIPSNLVEKVRTGECILFLGAAIHAPPPEGSNLTWEEATRPLLSDRLTRQLAEDSKFVNRYPEKEFPWEYPLNLQRVSLFADTPDGGGRSALIDHLRRYVQQGKKPSPIVKALAQLPFKIIVTTNYDKVFETALGAAGKECQQLIYNPRFNEATPDFRGDPTKDEPFVFKIHGDLSQRESIVITDEDYITFVQRMADKEGNHPVPLSVRYHMKRWPTLFLGYSLRDFNLRLLFRTLRWGMDEANYPLSFSVDRGPDPLIKQIWQHERNIVLFVVEDLWSFVPALFEQVSGQPMAKPSQVGI